MPCVRSRAGRAALCGLWLVGIALSGGCADDSQGASGCEAAGASETCECANGADGQQLCLASGELSACNCAAVRTVPCSAPGIAFACRCDTGQPGTEVCRNDGRYTPCDCSDGAAAQRDGASPDPGDTPTPPSECPDAFVCVEQMGVRACTDDSGVPPLCSVDTDCDAAGLPEATCVDPMIGGVRVCYQPC